MLEKRVSELIALFSWIRSAINERNESLKHCKTNKSTFHTLNIYIKTKKGIASKKNFFIIMEYLEGGSLLEYL